MIRWTPLIAASLLALLSACSGTPKLDSSSSQLQAMAKGGRTSENSLSLVVLGDSLSRNADPATQGPKIGDMVTFDVKTSVAEPYVRVTCYVNGIAYYMEMHGFFSSYPGGQTFTLGPNWIWTNQAANCTAELTSFARGKTGVLATQTFTVLGQ